MTKKFIRIISNPDLIGLKIISLGFEWDSIFDLALRIGSDETSDSDFDRGMSDQIGWVNPIRRPSSSVFLHKICYILITLSENHCQEWRIDLSSSHRPILPLTIGILMSHMINSGMMKQEMTLKHTKYTALLLYAFNPMPSAQMERYELVDGTRFSDEHLQ